MTSTPTETNDIWKERVSKKARRKNKKNQRLKFIETTTADTSQENPKPTLSKRKQQTVSELKKAFPYIANVKYFEEVVKEMKLNSFDKDDIALKEKITTALLNKQEQELNNISDSDEEEQEEAPSTSPQKKKPKSQQKQKSKQPKNVNNDNQNQQENEQSTDKKGRDEINVQNENENENEEENEDEDENENENEDTKQETNLKPKKAKKQRRRKKNKQNTASVSNNNENNKTTDETINKPDESEKGTNQQAVQNTKGELQPSIQNNETLKSSASKQQTEDEKKQDIKQSQNKEDERELEDDEDEDEDYEVDDDEEDEEDDEEYEDDDEDEEEEEEDEEDDEEEDADEEDEEDEEDDETQNENENNKPSKQKTVPSKSQKAPQVQPKVVKNDSKNKKPASSRDLLSRDLQSFNPLSPNASSLLRQWTQQLSQSSNNNTFVKTFDELEGVEIIAEKILTSIVDLQLSGDDNKDNSIVPNTRLSASDIRCSDDIVRLFDATLQGSTNYHQWLVNEIVLLANTILQCSSNKADELKNLLTQQLKKFVSAQKLQPVSTKSDISKEAVVLPSHILTRERKKDPINDLFRNLDMKAQKVGDVYHNLKSQEMAIKRMKPTANDSFQHEYRQVKESLDRYDRQLGTKLSRLNEKLQHYQNQQRQIDSRRDIQIGPLQNNLNNLRSQQEDLKIKKSELEQQLARIDNELAITERDCIRIQRDIDTIQKQHFPEVTKLKSNMDELTFESAALHREQGCYRQLSNIIDRSYDQLDNWSNTNINSQANMQNSLAMQYFSLLSDYIIDFANIRQFLNKRIQYLRKCIDDIKNQNEQARQLLGPHSVTQADTQIKEYSECIDIDETINHNVLHEIYQSLDNAKAVLGDDWFYNFITQINDRIADTVDLNKYLNNPNMYYRAQQVHIQQRQPYSQSHVMHPSGTTTSSIGTSTTNNDFAVNNNNLIQKPIVSHNIIPNTTNISTNTSNSNNDVARKPTKRPTIPIVNSNTGDNNAINFTKNSQQINQSMTDNNLQSNTRRPPLTATLNTPSVSNTNIGATSSLPISSTSVPNPTHIPIVGNRPLPRPIPSNTNATNNHINNNNNNTNNVSNNTMYNNMITNDNNDASNNIKRRPITQNNVTNNSIAGASASLNTTNQQYQSHLNTQQTAGSGTTAGATWIKKNTNQTQSRQQPQQQQQRRD